MSRVHPLRFDALEARELLTAARAAAARARPAIVAAPVVLDGTLAVNDRAASMIENADGTSTVSVPVSGPLGPLGEVRGVWNETVDTFGDITGLDALRLRNAKGTLVVAFDNETPGKPQPGAKGTVFVEDLQRVFSGTGAYARATETGSIEIVSNAARTVVKDLSLHTRGT